MLIKRYLIKSLAVAGALFVFANAAFASDFGYCTDVVNRNNIFRVGNTEKQGMAIKLSQAKLQMLKGCNITGLKSAFGSKRANGGKVTAFVSRDLGADPLMSKSFDITDAVKWVNLDFGDSYTITGDEEALYIGYTAEISTASPILMADGQGEFTDCCFLYVDGEWTDAYGLGYGNVSLRVTIDNALAITDVLLKPLAVDGYFKAQKGYELSSEVFNFGSETVEGIDYVVEIGGVQSAPTHLDVNLKQGESCRVVFPDLNSDTDGSRQLSIGIYKVNGKSDDDMSDNVFVDEIFYYPADMERGILLEGFTGQKCSNCPSGHATISSFIEAVESSHSEGTADTRIIEVMHHSGYQPDQMSMDADYDYTYFYASASTFAPAVMLNRTQVPSIGDCPVMNVDRRNLDTAYDFITNTQPYVSLGLETIYDKDTREVSVTLDTYTHYELPTEKCVLNVMLVQNGIKAYQLPVGSNYTHNAVFRGALTGSSWGNLLNDEALAAGGSAHWSTTFTLPETIFSDYWNEDNVSDTEREAYTIPTSVDDMYIVAYVASFAENDVNAHNVFNTVSAPLGDSYVQGGMAASDDIVADRGDSLVVRVVGSRIIVEGQYDLVQVYSIDGKTINPEAALTHGMYVVRAVKGKEASVAKVLIK